MSDSDLQTPPPPVVPAQTREEIIQAVAKTLIARREERDLTLEKVSQVIKIRLFYLQAIEKGKWEDLPGEVYIRGFIKRYAGFLGLDGESLLATYIGAQAPLGNETNPTAKPPENADVNRMQFLWIGLVCIFVVVFIKLIQKERTAPLNSTAPVAPVVLTSSTTINAVVPTSQVVLEKHSIEVFSPYPLWLRVAASDKTFEGFIPQASSWSWKGTGTFSIRLGHAKQVSMLFDGKRVTLTEDQRAITLPNAN